MNEAIVSETSKMDSQEVIGKKTKLIHFAGLLRTDGHIIRASAIYFEWFTFLVTQLTILDISEIINKFRYQNEIDTSYMNKYFEVKLQI